MLILHKIDFKIKKNNKRQEWTLYSSKGDSSSRRHNTYQHTCTGLGSTKMYETIFGRSKGETEKHTIIVGYPIDSNAQSSHIETQQEIH